MKWWGRREPEPGVSPWPICEECHLLPAVCFGADLVNPLHRCGRCCWLHDGNDATVAHMRAEGLSHLVPEAVA